MLANTRKRNNIVRVGLVPTKKSGVVTFDNLGSLASITGLFISLYALRQSTHRSCR